MKKYNAMYYQRMRYKHNIVNHLALQLQTQIDLLIEACGDNAFKTRVALTAIAGILRDMQF